MLIKIIKPVDTYNEHEVSVSTRDGKRIDETMVFLDVERYDESSGETTELYVNLTAAEALDLAEALTTAVRTTLNA
jgi:hypothetical protein